MPDSPRVRTQRREVTQRREEDSPDKRLHERATDVRSNIGIEESLDPVETCTRAREELGLCVCHAAPALIIVALARPLRPLPVAPRVPEMCVAQA